MSGRPMECPTCGSEARLLDAGAVLGAERGHSIYVWACARWPACDTFVKCWRATTLPSGSLADRATREARHVAHTAFMRLWIRGGARGGMSKAQARRAGYRWLAEQLGRHRRDCHIGWLDLETCREVITLCDAARRHLPERGSLGRDEVSAVLQQVA